MSNEIAKKDAPSAIIAQMEGQFAKVLPKILTPDRFCRVVLTAVNKNATLADALNDSRNKASVLSAFMRCAEMGLEPDGRRAAITCYRKGSGGYDVTLIPMYQGLAELAMRSGLISNIHTDKVCENDDFTWDTGEIHHKIDWRKPRGKAYAYYCVVRFKDGSVKTETMSLEEIEAIRDRSNAYKSATKYGKDCPWTTDFDEMAKKGLAVDTPIFTSKGWSTMGDLNVGDLVYDINGDPTEIIAVSEVKHIPCYELTFSNGEKIICDNEHRWVCGFGSNAKREIGAHEIGEIYSRFKSGIPVSVPVALPAKTKYFIGASRAYLLGYWLGNGHSYGASVSCDIDDANEIISHIGASEFELGTVRRDHRSHAVQIGIRNGFKDFLRAWDLLENKHIPEEAFSWSIEDRIALIRGLMDSDGCVSGNRGRAVFTNTNKEIAKSVFSLVHSLGEIANMSIGTCRGYGKTVDCYRVEWKPANFYPVTLSRKLLKCLPRKIPPYRSIKNIELIDSVPTRCIAVASPTKTYLAGKTFVPTHNTVFRRCSKWLPLSPELRAAIESDDEDYRGAAAEIKHAVNDKFAQASGLVDEPVVDVEAGDPEPETAPAPEATDNNGNLFEGK